MFLFFEKIIKWNSEIICKDLKLINLRFAFPLLPVRKKGWRYSSVLGYSIGCLVVFNNRSANFLYTIFSPFLIFLLLLFRKSYIIYL